MPLQAANGDVLLSVFVKPNRSKSALLGVRSTDGRVAGTLVLELEVALAAPPVEGVANAELIALLAKRLRVRKTSIQLESGHTSRHKVVRIHGASVAAVRQALDQAGCRLQGG